MLVLLFGESFRLGGQCNRNRGNALSYQPQIEACQSHIKFIEKHKASVYIASYDTPYNEDLLSIYKPYLVGSSFYPDVIGMNALLHETIQKANIQNYESIFCIRIDLYLKDLIEVFKPSSIILFPSITWVPHHKIDNHPRVNDTMFFIPKKYYNFINYFSFGHECWFMLMNHLTYEDMDTIIHSYHDSDSEKDFNPLYRIVNRPESSTHRSGSLVFNKRLPF
jgi:hypothetical protein